MTSATSLFSKLGLGGRSESREEPPAAAPSNARPQEEGSQFDRMGRLGERVGEQIAFLATRLEDLQTLREDFASIVQPVSSFLRTHEEAQTRILELEAVVAKEREDLRALRRELSEERNDAGKLRSDFAAAMKKLGMLEDAASAREEQISSLQSSLDDSRSQAAYLSQQLAAQSERNESLTELAENNARALEAAEQKLSAEQARASDLADVKETQGAELARLQETVEQLSPQLLSARRRMAELEAQVQDASLVLRSLESKLEAERDLRSSIEQSRAQETAAWESERSTITLQLESLTTRYATASRLLEQARQFGREKSEELLRAEKAIKEALDSRLSSERRLSGAQDEARQARADASISEGKIRELTGRCEMLERAMVAKDAQIEQVNSRATALTEQIAATTSRFEQDRSALEISNRKLIEQLQNEKAERALVQGALSIARSSREKLLTQIAALKNQKRGFGAVEQPQIDDVISTEPKDIEAETNVRMLKASER